MLKPRPGSSRIHVVGAGPVGSLLAVYLARRGFDVEVYERRPDMRKESISAGRSINLAVSTRGLHALRELGLEQEILKQAIPMRGRMMHALDGQLTFQPYGVKDWHYINSISRGGLNKTLMTAAEATGRVQIHFNRKIDSLDSVGSKDQIVIGTDGSASAIRADLLSQHRESLSESELDYGYKELTIAPGAGGSFKLEKNALHIWPRGTYMLIALPNFDGSFTCTLFLPHRGPLSFGSLASPEDVREFFESKFADAVPLLEKLEETFFSNPTGHMVTVKCAPWNVGGRVALVGDAAHAIVPFFGQGMNCGFEDCSVLNELLDQHDDWAAAFDAYTRARKANADAIADMAVENFTEMRDKVGDPAFLLEKAVEKILQEKFPGDYVSRYALVTFSRVPYRFAAEVGVVQAEILAELCRGLRSADEVNLRKAEHLVASRLRPLMQAQKGIPC